MNEQEVKTLVCPQCKKKGSLRLDALSMSVRCRTCGVVKPTKSPNVPRNHKMPPPNVYPSIPDGANYADIIEERDSTGKTVIGRIYCPRDQVVTNPIFAKAEGSSAELAAQFSRYLQENPHAQFALYRYDKQIKNIRRYRRDLYKRNKDEITARWPFNP
jgi:hypothetical protein